MKELLGSFLVFVLFLAWQHWRNMRQRQIETQLALERVRLDTETAKARIAAERYIAELQNADKEAAREHERKLHEMQIEQWREQCQRVGDAYTPVGDRPTDYFGIGRRD